MTFNQKKLLVTGGSGLLGSEFQKLLPEAFYPSSKSFDVTNYQKMVKFVSWRNISTILHAAAFTSPPKIDQNPQKAIDVNIIGTANVVKLCLKYSIRLVYVSTDYVFKGNTGNYQEDDPVCPANKYAWSKLGGECAVRLSDNSLIIRTSFSPQVFPYDKAFIDQWTSREPVKIIARKIVRLIKSNLTGVIHVGGKRVSVYSFAKKLTPDKKIEPVSIKQVNFQLPKDTSLNTSKFQKFIGKS